MLELLFSISLQSC